jgi:peptide/nickel transport system permease protein
MIPILIGVTLLTFCLFNLFGGDPAIRYVGKSATPERLAQIRAELGVDRSLPEQYLFYVKQIFTLDFGRSWSTKQTIATMITDGIGATLSVTAPAFVASTVFCLFLGLLTAFFRGTIFDRGIMVTCLALTSLSSLVYVLAFQYVFAYQAGLFPISGWDPSWLGRWEYLVLPSIILFVISLGPNILIYRAVIIEEAFQDYARTARAKGLTIRNVYGRHILKNAMIPIITIIVIEVPFLITGSVVIENFFGIPGIGGITIKALNESDFPVIKAMTVISSVLYMVFNLLSDVLYAAVDPRIKLG